MSGSGRRGDTPEDYDDYEVPDHIDEQGARNFANWAFERDPSLLGPPPIEAPIVTRAPVSQAAQAQQPRPQNIGSAVRGAFMGGPYGGEIPPQQGRGGQHAGPYVTNYEQEQANLRQALPQAMEPPRPMTPSYGTYSSDPGRGYVSPSPRGSSSQSFGGYAPPSRGGSSAQDYGEPSAPVRGGISAQGTPGTQAGRRGHRGHRGHQGRQRAAVPQQTVAQEPDVPEPPPWDPLCPSVVWDPNNRWVLKVNERVSANRRWTADQVFQLKVIGASFVSWDEARTLGQVFPGRRASEACQMKWYSLMNGRPFWTEADDEEFLRYLDYWSDWDEAGRNEEWQAILRRMQARGHTEPECEGRWKLHLRHGRAMGGRNIGRGRGMPGAAAQRYDDRRC